MGCFSVKCALSSLPIRAGDKVVMLLGSNCPDAKRGRRSTGGHYTQGDFFNLLAPPIFGEYNDYGWVTNPDADSTEFAYQALQLHEQQEQINPAPLIDVRADEVHWYHFAEQMKLKVDDHYDYTFIHKSIWDSLVDASQNNVFPGINTGYLTDEFQELASAKYDCYIGQYSIFGTPGNFFDMGLTLLPTLLSVEIAELSRFYSSLLECVAEHEDFRRHLLNLIQNPSNSLSAQLQQYNPNLVKRTLTNVVGWFTSSTPQLFALKLCKLSHTNPSYKAILRNTQLMYNALSKSAFVVRGQKQLGSEEQCGGPMWPHVTLARSIALLISQQVSAQEGYNSLDENYEIKLAKLIPDEQSSP